MDTSKEMSAHDRLAYETLNEEVRRRSDIVVNLAGTIFVVTSFVLLGQSAISTDPTNKFVTALTALGVYSFYLFVLAYTSAWLDAITFEKLNELEVKMGIAAHRYVRWRIGRDFGKRIWVRRASWSILLLLETIAAAYIVLYAK